MKFLHWEKDAFLIFKLTESSLLSPTSLSLSGPLDALTQASGSWRILRDNCSRISSPGRGMWWGCQASTNLMYLLRSREDYFLYAEIGRQAFVCLISNVYKVSTVLRGFIWIVWNNHSLIQQLFIKFQEALCGMLGMLGDQGDR